MQDEPTREELTVSQQPTFSSVLVGVDGTSTGRDAIALADRLCAPSGRLTLANIVLMPSPVYHNFHATRLGGHGARCSNASATHSEWSLT